MNSIDETTIRDSARRLARAANESGLENDVEFALSAQLEVLLQDEAEAPSTEQPDQP